MDYDDEREGKRKGRRDGKDREGRGETARDRGGKEGRDGGWGGDGRGTRHGLPPETSSGSAPWIQFGFLPMLPWVNSLVRIAVTICFVTGL